MKRHPGQLILKSIMAATAAAAIAFGVRLPAQDPFGQFGKPPPAPNELPADPARGKADPAAIQPAGKAADPAKPAEPPPDPAQYSLPIRAVLESNPQTPAQLMRAASVLIDFGEPALARPYVTKLQGAALDEAALADLVRQLGSGPFLKIAGEKALEPEGRDFGDRAIAAASTRARNPKRLAQLVEQLGDPSAEAQRAAIAELLNAHEYAAPPLLAALNDPAKKAAHARARDVLAALAQDAIAPLLATLDGPDSAAKIAAVEALGRIGASQATPRLVGLYTSPATSPRVRAAAENALFDLHGKAPTAREAARFLEQEVRNVLSGERRLSARADGNLETWVWDPAKAQPVAATLTLDQAKSDLAARLAPRLLEVSPDDARHRRLYLVSLLEAEAYRVGRDSLVPRGEGSAFSVAAESDAAAVEDALSYALAEGHVAAAAIAAQVLGEIGDIGMLVRGGAKLSPLAQALTHEDRRLRFAAAQAIVQLKPIAPFAGLSYLKSALVDFATSSGTRRALVGFPNIETAQQLAGMVNSLGFETDTLMNGRDVLLAASKSSEYELILVSSRIDRGPLYLVVQDLRKQTNTGHTPIIVLAEDDELGRLREAVRHDPLTTVVLRPRVLESMEHAVESAMRRAGDRIVPAEVRQRQATAALRSIGELSAAAPKVFAFRSHETDLLPVLYVPSLNEPAARAIAEFGTHASQRSLLEIANRASQPVASRQAAALAFGESVRRFGVRLTKDEILRQYDRYNQSELEDRASQELLGAVLDAIELPTQTSESKSAGAR